jgi:ferric-dicitrate binding protein FerR (iron transport regulator)
MSQQIPTEQQELDAADRLIDRATAQMRDFEPDPKVVEAAAARVWQQLSRRGIKLVRDGEAAPAPVVRPLAARPSRFAQFRGLALAASVLAAAGAAFYFGSGLLPSGPLATVAAVDGQLFHVASVSHLPVEVGSQIAEGDVLRTSREGGAEIQLADGSTVEMSPRAEISIEDGRRGTTVHLERGSVIVHAAKQRDRHLYVATGDCLVSVTGTIFSVNSGTKGSRVSVVEGEVQVDHQGENAVLHPGDQVTTTLALAKVPVEQEIAWSRDVDQYLALLKEVRELSKAIAQQVPHPELRYDSRLLDLMPSDTLFYAAMPNVPETLGKMHVVVRERLASSPALAEWWAQQDAGLHQHFDRVLETFSDLGAQLGNEVAVGVHLGEDDPGLLLLAEVRDQAGLRALIDRELGQNAAELHGHLVLVDDPLTAQPAEDALYLWLTGDLAVGSSDLAHLREVAGYLGGATNPFLSTAFYREIAELYGEGVEFVIAGNIHDVVVATHALDGGGEGDPATFTALGFDNVRHLMVEQKKVGDNTQHRATLSFSGQRSGLFSWLAAPAPMGSLGFISPEAKLVVAAVLRDPAQLFDEIGKLADEGLPAALAEFERTYGLSVRDDFMATIGGEFAIALDGPLAPKPAFKVVLEVYDPAKFQWALDQALVEVNRKLGAEGKPVVEIKRQAKGGRTYFEIPAGAFSVHYTFAEGYLLMASDSALLDQALRYRSSGYSIATSPRFLERLPEDGRNNLSAVIYQDLGSVMGPLAQYFGKSLSPEQQAQIADYAEANEPSLAYAYGEPDKLIFASSSEGDLLSKALLGVLGFKSPEGLGSLLSLGQIFAPHLDGAAEEAAAAPAPPVPGKKA